MDETNPDPAIPAAAPPGPPTPRDNAASIKNMCDHLRAELLSLEKMARTIKLHPGCSDPDTFPGQHSEMIAQSMLAVRDIESARMRIGKVLQYGRDGVSIFDRPEPQP